MFKAEGIKLTQTIILNREKLHEIWVREVWFRVEDYLEI